MRLTRNFPYEEILRRATSFRSGSVVAHRRQRSVCRGEEKLVRRLYFPLVRIHKSVCKFFVPMMAMLPLREMLPLMRAGRFGLPEEWSDMLSTEAGVDSLITSISFPLSVKD